MAVFTAIATGLATLGATILGGSLVGASALGLVGFAAVGGAVIGAVAGGVIAAVKGENILKGALKGGLMGAAVGGALGFAGMFEAGLTGAEFGVSGISESTAATSSAAGAPGAAGPTISGAKATGGGVIGDAGAFAPGNLGVAGAAKAPVVAAAKTSVADKLALGAVGAQFAGGLLTEEPEDPGELRHKRAEAGLQPLSAARIEWEGGDGAQVFNNTIGSEKFNKDNWVGSNRFSGSYMRAKPVVQQKAQPAAKQTQQQVA